MSLAELQQQLLADREALLQELGLSENRNLAAQARLASAAPTSRKRLRGAAGEPRAAPTRTQPSRARALAGSGAAGAPGGVGDEDEDGAPQRARRARGAAAGAAAAPRSRSEGAAARAAAARGAAGGARVVRVDGTAVDARPDAGAAALPADSLVKAVVERDTVIRAFVEGALGLDFVPGRGFHELRDDLPVNVYTTEYLVEAPGGEVFKGEAAKKAAGGAAFARGRKKQGAGGGALPEGWRIYLRSRSYTRKLLKGQRFIYERW